MKQQCLDRLEGLQQRKQVYSVLSRFIELNNKSFPKQENARRSSEASVYFEKVGAYVVTIYCSSLALANS